MYIRHIVMCVLAGVMYWGDTNLDKIQTAYLNGTGRRVLLTESYASYRGFTLNDGNIYFTDLKSTYVPIFSC